MQEDMSVYTVVYTVESTVTWRCLVYESLVGNPQGCCAANDFAAHQGLKVREALLKSCVCLSQVVKQQQMDENNRLRATLEEWSHRNAKWALRYFP